ncbi:Error-prone DNA polymerase [Candidatus Rubidus massiliensis]|nr:Error-prone DNA polymerase [Candidatus Rubidus massiliensis]
MSFKADIHCHSTYSDGTLTPKELITMANDIGLKGFSITDHDSVEAFHEMSTFAKEFDIKVIPGAEFSCMQKKESVHILGYSFDNENPHLLDFCRKHHERRSLRNKEILDKLTKKGLPITEEEITTVLKNVQVKNKQTIGRPHIALVMMKKGYVKTINEAFKLYLGEGQSCFAPGQSFTVEETINVIHQCKGLAVIAHPHLLNKGKLLNELLELPFDGIECYYAKFPPEKNSRFLKIAEKKNLIATGGSDFHGSIKPDLQLGCSWVDEKTFMTLFNHFQQNLK